uniref:Uncharacterized protein n=1 Tax=Salix viminalis TaxID=40686 RepID=A0A6N2K5P2_SALVM
MIGGEMGLWLPWSGGMIGGEMGLWLPWSGGWRCVGCGIDRGRKLVLISRLKFPSGKSLPKIRTANADSV